jgi:hypothetical protein
MSKLLQLRGGTTAEHTSFTGAVREVTVDTDKDTLVVHDGTTAGGHVMPRTKADIDALNINADTLDGKQLATIESEYQAFANTAAANVVDSAPGTLDTLNELAAALGDDANFSTTVTNSIATKMPLAGGTFTGDVSFGDNNKAIFGAGSDLQIYHDTINSIVKENGTGDLWLMGTNIQMKNGGNTATYLTASSGGAVTLYHDNASKLASTSTGVDITGEITADGIALGDSQKATFGASDDLQIYHDGSHSYIKDVGTGNFELSSNGDGFYFRDGSSNYLLTLSNGGSAKLWHNGSEKLATSASGITVNGTINGGDLRGDIFYMGRDNNDYFASETDKFNWFLDGNEDMRLENDGDLHVDGNVIAYSTTISDERLKKDIVKIDSALDKVDQINGYTFTYTADGKKSAGVIAQEVEKVLPSAITESTLPLKMGEDDKTEYKTVQYDQLIGLLVEAVKELKAEVAELKGK